MIDSWPYDLLISGNLQLDSDVTDEPVESGPNVSDHIRPLPAELTLESLVSDTPIGEIANHESRRIDDVSAAVFGEDQIPLPSDEAYRRLTAIRDEKRIVIVEIPVATRAGKPGKRTFVDMTITGLSIPLGPEHDGGLRFSVTLKNIKIVKNKRTTIKASVTAPTKGADNKGLSLDKVINGSDVLWRKGSPPGRSPATDPPGKIVGTEVCVVKNGKIYHSDGKTPLKTEELEAFTKDLNRDSALSTRRSLARIDDKIARNDDHIERALEFAKAKEDNPGKFIDRALFGL